MAVGIDVPSRPCGTYATDQRPCGTCVSLLDTRGCGYRPMAVGIDVPTRRCGITRMLDCEIPMAVSIDVSSRRRISVPVGGTPNIWQTYIGDQVRREMAPYAVMGPQGLVPADTRAPTNTNL